MEKLVITWKQYIWFKYYVIESNNICRMVTSHLEFYGTYLYMQKISESCMQIHSENLKSHNVWKHSCLHQFTI